MARNDSANGRCARDAVHRACFVRQLLTDACLDQYPFRTSLDEHTVHVHSDPVLIVGRTHSRPEIARDHTEHRPSVEAKLCVRHNLDAVISKLHAELLTLRAHFCRGLALFFEPSAFGFSWFCAGSPG